MECDISELYPDGTDREGGGAESDGTNYALGTGTYTDRGDVHVCVCMCVGGAESDGTNCTLGTGEYSGIYGVCLILEPQTYIHDLLRVSTSLMLSCTSTNPRP